MPSDSVGLSLRAKAVEVMTREINETRGRRLLLSVAWPPQDKETEEVMRAFGEVALTALLALIDARGFAVVPKEPVREMWAAGANAIAGYKQRHHDKVVAEVWAQMLAASPNPLVEAPRR